MSQPMQEVIRIERLRPGDATGFEGLLRIYEEAIPKNERKGADTMREMLERPDYEFLVARIGDGVAGFSIVKSLSGTSACLLEYMAVDQSIRGRGIGGALFRAASGSKATASRYLLMEVDSDATRVRDRHIRTRRKAFYRALGCREVTGLSYLMPSVTGQEPPDMNILVYRRTLGTKIDKAQLRLWLECVYAEVYEKPVDDPRIELMLSTLPDQIELQ